MTLNGDINDNRLFCHIQCWQTNYHVLMFSDPQKHKYSSAIPLKIEDCGQENSKTDETALILLQMHSRLRNNCLYNFHENITY